MSTILVNGIGPQLQATGEWNWVFYAPFITLATLLTVLVIILLLQREPRRPHPTFRAFCAICKNELTWLPDANRWYCDRCIKYYSVSEEEQHIREYYPPPIEVGTISVPNINEYLSDEYRKLEENLSKLEIEKRKGTISDKVYETLKAEYRSRMERLKEMEKA